MIVIPFSIIGARLYYVLFELENYLQHPAEIFAIRDGGLAIYGGVIVGVLVILFVCRHKKIPIPAMMDLAVFGLLIGQIIGRWGNFMNREAFGAETEIFCRMGLTAPDTVDLLDRLRKDGLDVPLDVLTVEECADAIAAALATGEGR